jgi:hypothetical protein
MQSGSSPTLDANAAHSPEIREDDPRHLGNLTKKMNSINAQVSCDTKYDPTPPPRVDKDGKPVKEFFMASVPVPSARKEAEVFYALGGLSIIIIIMVIIYFLDPRSRFFILRSKVTLYILGSTILLSIVTILLSHVARKQLIHDMWYPRFN